MRFLQALTSEPLHSAKTPKILVFHFQLVSMIRSVVSKAGRKSGIFHRAFLFPDIPHQLAIILFSQ